MPVDKKILKLAVILVFSLWGWWEVFIPCSSHAQKGTANLNYCGNHTCNVDEPTTCPSDCPSQPLPVVNLQTITPESSVVNPQHILELRTFVDFKRNQCRMSAFPWKTVVNSNTEIKRSDIIGLRKASAEIYSWPPARDFPLKGFTDDTIISGDTPVRSIHIEELRTVVTNASCCGDGTCNSPAENYLNCIADCPSQTPPAGCPDGNCGPGENYFNCPQDCPFNPEPIGGFCGDGMCSFTENQRVCIAADDKGLCLLQDFQCPDDCNLRYVE